MTELEEKLLAENERLRKELEDLKRKRFEMEVLDETHVKFNGQVFHKNSEGRFYRGVSLHEAIWRAHFGDIPAGYIIHHRNKDKADNHIENLQLMTEAEHRAWHNQHDKISYRCDYCGAEITKSAMSHAGKKHFCDVNCWNRYIHANKIYYEERTCIICGQKFSVYKYRKTKTCSDVCHGKLISLSKKKRT